MEKFKVGDEIVRTKYNSGDNGEYASRMALIGGNLFDVVKIISKNFSTIIVSFNGKNIQGNWSATCFELPPKIKSWKEVMKNEV